MVNVRIHGKEVDFDSADEKTYHFVHSELMSSSRSEEFEAFCEKAYRDSDHKAVIVDRMGHRYELASKDGSRFVFILTRKD